MGLVPLNLAQVVRFDPITEELRADQIIENNKGIDNFLMALIMKDTPGFLGIFDDVDLPTQLDPTQKQSGIVNLTVKVTQVDPITGKSFTPGSHWVCFYSDPELPYREYFNSFGLGPSPQVEALLRDGGKEIRLNNTWFQPIESKLCGYYCCGYIKARLIGLTPEDIVYSFVQGPDTENDRIAIMLSGL